MKAMMPLGIHLMTSSKTQVPSIVVNHNKRAVNRENQSNLTFMTYINRVVMHTDRPLT